MFDSHGVSVLTDERYAEDLDFNTVWVVGVLHCTGVDAVHFNTDIGDMLVDGE